MHQKFSFSAVQAYWDAHPCGTDCTTKEALSSSYFEEIEKHRYAIEPEIFSFAQFSRYRNKRVLEVGVGAGTDFVQWVRSGAIAHGVDISQQALAHVTARLSLEGLSAEEIGYADCSSLPYKANFFDCVYSWGVIHHSSSIQRSLSEIVRVTKPGGEIKVMIYHRHSLYAFYRYLLYVKKYKNPFVTFKTVLSTFQESQGTQALTKKEALKICEGAGMRNITIASQLTSHDLLWYKSSRWQTGAQIIAHVLGGNRVGWFLLIKGTK